MHWLISPVGFGPPDQYAGVRVATAEILAGLIQIVALLLAISIATGFLEAQISYLTGAPTVLSAVWAKIGAVVICLILALAAVTISNTLVGVLF
jgi:hypothetical protein